MQRDKILQCRPAIRTTTIEVDRVASEWDAIAFIRHKQILSYDDISYWHVLLPSLKKLMERANRTSLLDVGCGLGFATKEFSPFVGYVLGVDVSSVCIGLARRSFSHLTNAFFVNCQIEHLVPQHSGTFNSAIANMVLMTTPNLDALLLSVRKLLRKGAFFAFTITHPCFWPHYWEYDQAEWFNYTEEIAIEAPFRISLDGNCTLRTTHIHRPLSNYFDYFLRNGFSVDSVIEPTPDNSVGKAYLSKWHYPRFLAGLLIAQ